MKAQIQSLIKQSRALADSDKELYLAMVGMLPGDKLVKLAEIFETEKSATDLLDADLAKKSSKLNQKFVAEIEELYKKEYQAGVQSSEEVEKSRGADILKQLDNL